MGGWGRTPSHAHDARQSHRVRDEREARRSTKKGREKEKEEEEEEVCANPASGHGSCADLIHGRARWLEREKQGRERKLGEQRPHHGPHPQLSAPHSVRTQRSATAAEPRTDQTVAHQKRVQMNAQPHLDKMRVIFIQNAGFVAAFSPFRRESVMSAAFRTTDKVTDLQSASAGSCQAIKE